MTKQRWTPDEVSRMLSNPFYTGICVHPDLAVQRPAYRDKFLETARGYIDTMGPANFVHTFLSLLQFPDEWTRRVVLVHPRFTEEHKGIITVERFIQAGAIQIRDLGITAYCELLLDNLESGE